MQMFPAKEGKVSHKELFQELKKDHESVKRIIQQMKSLPSKKAGDMLMLLKNELYPHQEAEEKTFYKSLEGKQDSRQLALKGEEEHHIADIVIEDLEKAPKDDRWMAKLEVLDDLVKEHFGEEEGRVFKAARSLDESEIDNIFRDFQSTKLQIKSDMNERYSTYAEAKSGNLADEDLGRIV